MRAGTKDNIIPDEAELLVSVRTFTKDVRDQVVEAIGRIARAEADRLDTEAPQRGGRLLGPCVLRRPGGRRWDPPRPSRPSPAVTGRRPGPGDRQ